MSSDEFADYRAYFVPDYAAEITANYGVSALEGERRAQDAIDRDLPLGAATAGHVLVCIVTGEAGDEVIGYLWYRPDAAMRSVFVCDFCILPPHRGSGLGKRVLAGLELQLRQEGYDEIRLRVAADNGRALHVYESGGFRVTGMNMMKALRAF